MAQGRIQSWEIQAARRWAVNYLGQPNPLPGWADEPRQTVVGSAWDAQSQRLYVALRQTFDPDAWGERGVLVYAYGLKA